MPRRKSTAVKNRRRIRRQRPTARNQKRQIASTQNQIIAIKKHINLTKQRMRWRCGFVGLNMDEYPLIIPLTSGPSVTTPATVNNSGVPQSVAWVETMTAATNSGNNTGNARSTFVVNKQYCDLTIMSGSEAALISHTAFIVQLKDKTARQTYVDTAGMSSLTRGNDYATPDSNTVPATDSGYGAFINTDKYKIIKRLELETAGSLGTAFPDKLHPGASGNNGRGTRTMQCHRAQFKLNYGSTVLKSAGDSQQDGGSLNYDDINPEQKRFLIIFNNNALVDGEYPTVSLSSLITGYAAE